MMLANLALHFKALDFETALTILNKISFLQGLNSQQFMQQMNYNSNSLPRMPLDTNLPSNLPQLSNSTLPASSRNNTQ